MDMVVTNCCHISCEKVTSYKLVVVTSVIITKMTKVHWHNEMPRVQQPRPFNNVAYGPYGLLISKTGNLQGMRVKCLH